MFKELKELFLKWYPNKNYEIFLSFLYNLQSRNKNSFNDPILLAYPDSVSNLDNLYSLLQIPTLKNSFSTIHILPIFESNADGGFAASSYITIDKQYGSWKHIQKIAKEYSVMIDAIFNHTSNEHPWFRKFLKNEEPYTNFYISHDPNFDYTQVTRPRTSPLFSTIEGKEVLTTFSDHQIDLNIKEYHVFEKLLEIISYYNKHNISGIRLDAISYIVKQSHTSCANLEETYDFTKLLIESIKVINKDLSIICEANFSDKENFNYIYKSHSDYIYQFSFSHLLLYCLHKKDFSYFVSWFNKTKPIHKQSLFYLSNHDGYALSGVKRILKKEEYYEYLSCLEEKKFKINYRSNQQKNTPEAYEVNTTLYSYLEYLDNSYIKEKYLLVMHILTQMDGKILLYYLDLIGEKNDFEEFEKTKENRSLHRKKFSLKEFETKLENSEFYPIITKFLKKRKTTSSMNTTVSYRNPFLKITKYNSKETIETYYNISCKEQTLSKGTLKVKPFCFISINKNNFSTKDRHFL